MFSILKCSTRAIYGCQTCKFKLFFGVSWKHEAAAATTTIAAEVTTTTTTAVAASEKTHEFSRM